MGIGGDGKLYQCCLVRVNVFYHNYVCMLLQLVSFRLKSCPTLMVSTVSNCISSLRD